MQYPVLQMLLLKVVVSFVVRLWSKHLLKALFEQYSICCILNGKATKKAARGQPFIYRISNYYLSTSRDITIRCTSEVPS